MSRKWLWILAIFLIGVCGFYVRLGRHGREMIRLESNKRADDKTTRLVLMFWDDKMDLFPEVYQSVINNPAIKANPAISTDTQWYKQPFFKIGFIRISMPEEKLPLIEEALKPQLKKAGRTKIAPGLASRES